MITTEKDAARLPGRIAELDVPLLCLRVELQIDKGLDVLREALEGLFH